MKKENDYCKAKIYYVLAYFSLVFGIVSIFIYFISILIPLVALLCGILSLCGKNKSKPAIIGLILGILFTFQYVNNNYILPSLNGTKGGNSTNSSSTRKNVLDNSIESKLINNGYTCENNICTKSEYMDDGSLSTFEVNFNWKYINQYYETTIDEGEAYINTRYEYDNKTSLCTLYIPSLDLLIDYKLNGKTGEEECNYKLEDCFLNIENSKALVTYYNNLIN